jgi:hypothetical protein
VLEGWDQTGWQPLTEGLDGNQAAYWYVRGRTDEAEAMENAEGARV